jgi:hypothetical protein
MLANAHLLYLGMPQLMQAGLNRSPGGIENRGA